MLYKPLGRDVHQLGIRLGISVLLWVVSISSLTLGAAGDQVIEKRFDLDLQQNVETIPPSLARFPAGPLNQFLRLMSSLPAGERALDAVAKILTPLQQLMANSAEIDTSADDMTGNTPCADITVIFARGTTEPGNVGLVTGPPFFDAIKEQLSGKTLAVQGVNYPASFAGFNRNGTDGVPSMCVLVLFSSHCLALKAVYEMLIKCRSEFVSRAVSNCPNSRIVMSGYSQGALVVRATAELLPFATMSTIHSVVTFGDPKNQAPISGADDKFLVICNPDDSVCNGGFIDVSHLTYGAHATAAAQFVMREVNSE